MAGERRGYRAALRHRDVRLLLGGLVVSGIGSWAYNVALLAFVYERTHSLAWVGAAGLVRFVPGLLFSAYAGVLAERVERVRLMVVSDLLCAVFQALLVVVVVLDGPILLAIALSALTATAAVPAIPTEAAMLPQVAGEEDLAAANALKETLGNLIVVVGPAIGAGLVAAGSPSLAFALNAASFAASALIVVRMRARSRPSDVTEGGSAGILRQMTVGVRAITSSRTTATLVGLCLVGGFIYGTDTVLLVSYADERLDTGPNGFGYLLAGIALGGVLAAGVVNRVAGSARLGAIIAAGTIVSCVPTAALVLVNSTLPAVGLEVVRGVGGLFVDVLAITALQRAIAPELLTRVFGVFETLLLGSIAVGALVAPPVIVGLGLDAALLIMGLAVPALVVAAYPLLARMDSASAERVAVLAPRVDVLGRLPIFGGASRPVLERLAAVCEPQTAPPGTAIVREGEPADAFYVLVEGEAEVAARGEAGYEQVLRRLVAGSSFGELGLLERIPRTATVTALEPCELYRIDGGELLEALTAAPPSVSVLEEAGARLARTHPSRRLTYRPAVQAMAED